MSDRFVLDNGILRCRILTYGAILQSLYVPDQTGCPVDVVLGCDTPKDYALCPDYMGSIVGRYANRISNASFSMDGVRYRLTDNCNGNHIHGGHRGFNVREWEVKDYTSTSITLALVSEDGEEGYPGRLTAVVCYRLEENALHINYDVTSDKDTICNLTNHSYFNLSGHDSGSVLQQQLQLAADAFLPTGRNGVPIGTIVPVLGSPMDFRNLHAIGDHIADPSEQILNAGGYDHCFVVNGMPGRMRKAAVAQSERTGISMEIYTDCPGIQLYTANGLGPGRKGKNGVCYGPHEAFCLETQFFPDSPNQAIFPSARLNKTERFTSETAYFFFAGQKDNT